MNFDRIVGILRENTPEKLESLWLEADRVRRLNVGDEIHLRGLIEISNICHRNCLYCGIRAGNVLVERYRLTKEEILDSASKACDFGYGSVVLQAGEDPGISAGWMADIVSEIKATTGLAITLSLGEREEADYVLWKNAGADRYLMRFETSNKKLFNEIHPPLPGQNPVDRCELLLKLREFGYEIGGGVMIGIPGQSVEDLARDIMLFKSLELDMIGCGPFVPHPQTPLGKKTQKTNTKIRENQVSCDVETAFKVIALTRLVCPKSNIPCTTAVATVGNENGRKLGLMRGANVIMPNLTPVRYRKLYEIYPDKAAIYETAEQTHETVTRNIREIGRTVGTGRGDSQAMRERERWDRLQSET